MAKKKITENKITENKIKQKTLNDIHHPGFFFIQQQAVKQAARPS
jgi:hypothetical protein